MMMMVEGYDELPEGSMEGNDYSLNSDEFDDDEIDKSANEIDAEGWYILKCTKVIDETERFDKTPSICFNFSVTGTVDGQSPIGSMLYHRIYVATKGGGPPSEGARKMLIKLAMRAGLLKKVKGEDGKLIRVNAATGSRRMDVDMWMKMSQKELVAKATKEEDSKYGDKYRVEYSDFFQLDSPKVATRKVVRDRLGTGNAKGPEKFDVSGI